jgi:YHS domain-containing protein
MKQYKLFHWGIIGVTSALLGVTACNNDVTTESSQSPYTPKDRPVDSLQGAQNSDPGTFNAVQNDISAQQTTFNVNDQGLAIHGYDPVAYFKQGQAIEGNPAIRATWQGSQWLFATPAHRTDFLANPHRYVPQNGGFCTFGIVVEQKLDVDPMVWLIEDDKLYLFLSTETRANFLQDKVNNLKKVDLNWRKLEMP